MSQLECDLRTAAELGKQLLDRHDAHMKEIEEQRLEFLSATEKQNAFARSVDELETNNRLLEFQNQQSMRDNLALLKRLEELNTSLSDADLRNNALTSTLEEAETTVGRLSQRAKKTQNLEAQILTIEMERETLEHDLMTVSHDNKQSSVRFKQAERRVRELQDQLEHISMQSHVPVKPKQHNLSYSIWKAEPAISKIESGDTFLVELDTSNVHMRELLHSNSTLQDHVEELQRILASTQEEVIQLRNQYLRPKKRITSLGEEKAQRVPRKSISQELHEHHHYHYHIPSQGLKRSNKTKLLGSTEMLTERQTVHEYATPIKAIVKNGLASPPSTQRPQRDSGYFSLTPDSGRDESTSLSHPPSPSMDMPLAPLSVPVLQRRQHMRSSSHESIFMSSMTHSSSPNRLVKSDPLEESLSVFDLANDPAQNKPEWQMSCGPKLRHAASHESIFEPPCPSIPPVTLESKLTSIKRPYPSPLQNSASFATVSMSSATASYSSPSPVDVTKSPRGDSYKALRSAAAAQKLSRAVSTPVTGQSQQFWRRSTDKSIVGTSKASKFSSRWSSLVPRWHAEDVDHSRSLSSQPSIHEATCDTSGPDAAGKARDEPSLAERSATTAICLSGMAEQLLRDALDN